jgi:hypothetical protein
MSERVLRPDSWRAAEALEPRARVALALAAVDRVRTVLASHPAIVTLLRDATNAGWRWTAGAGATANAVYSVIPELLERVRDVERDEEGRNAIFAALSALYYAVWQIDRETPAETRAALPPLPGDVAETSAQTLRQALSYMVAAMDAAIVDEWIGRTITTLDELQRRGRPFDRASIVHEQVNGSRH